MARRLDERSLLEAALIGYQTEYDRISKTIAAIRRQLGRGGSIGDDRAPVPAKRHHISEAGRQRIAEAQRRRWAAQKKQAA